MKKRLPLRRRGRRKAVLEGDKTKTKERSNHIYISKPFTIRFCFTFLLDWFFVLTIQATKDGAKEMRFSYLATEKRHEMIGNQSVSQVITKILVGWGKGRRRMRSRRTSGLLREAPSKHESAQLRKEGLWDGLAMMDDGSNQAIGKEKTRRFSATRDGKRSGLALCWMHVHSYTKGHDANKRRRGTCGSVVAGWMDGCGDVVVGT